MTRLRRLQRRPLLAAFALLSIAAGAALLLGAAVAGPDVDLEYLAWVATALLVHLAFSAARAPYRRRLTT